MINQYLLASSNLDNSAHFTLLNIANLSRETTSSVQPQLLTFTTETLPDISPTLSNSSPNKLSFSYQIQMDK